MRFASKARVLRRQDELFPEDSWIAVLLGQGVILQGYDPLADSLPLEGTRHFLQHVKDAIAKTAHAMPPHQDFIDRHCSAGDSHARSIR
jgi:tryptophan 7-halogenase